MKTLNTILVIIGVSLIIGALLVIAYEPSNSTTAVGLGIFGAILTATGGFTAKTR